MASFSARLVTFLLRTTGAIRKDFTGGPGIHDRIAAARKAKPILPAPRLRRKAAVEVGQFSGRDVWSIAPKKGASGKRLLYFHGGGYIYAPAALHWNFLGHLATQYGIASIAPLYPLAPEACAQETVAFALDMYRDLLTRHAAKDIVIGGDSAGGGLTAAVLMAARDQGLPMPAAAVLICPWLEADPAHPDQRIIEPRDSILTLSGTADAGRIYARDLPLSDTRVSPIHGDWTGLPPMLVFGGGDDVLVTDARALHAKAPAINYIELQDMPHDWPIFSFPESRNAQARIAGFIRGGI